MKATLIITLMGLSPVADAQVLPSAIDCQVDYSFVKAKVFDSQCLKCHTGASAKAGVDISQFSEAVKHIAHIQSVVENDEMPPTSSLSTEDAEIVLAWIAQGAAEAAPTETQCVL